MEVLESIVLGAMSKALKERTSLKNPNALVGDLARLTNSGTGSGYYAALKGNKGSGKEFVGNQIKSFLEQCEYVTSTKQMSMLNLQNEVYQADNGRIQYFELEKNVLYIITDIKEFMHYYKNTNPNDGSAMSQAYKLLTRFTPGTYVLLSGEPEEIDEFMRSSDKAEFIYKRSIYELADYSLDQLYDRFVELLDQPHKDALNDGTREWFKGIAATYDKCIPLKNNELAQYLAQYTNSQEVPKGKGITITNPYKESKPKNDLDSIIGMENVKKTVKEFEDLIMFRTRAKKEGMKLPSTNMHMLFTGNPGTGKTTIARIIAGMLFNLGIIEKEDIKEVSASDLVAGYIGQTAIKTAEVIQEAMGGVLFIDEAYSLVTKGGSESYGKEAIATIIKAMEDNKDKLVVIFAGYKDEMADFVAVNPGLASRIGFTFDFDDYSPEELTQIFEKKIQAAGFEVGNGVLEQVQQRCEMAVRKQNFGNGRFIDRLIDRVILRHASGSGVSHFKTITADEIPGIKALF